MSILSLLFPEKCIFCGRLIQMKEYEERGCCKACANEQFVRRYQDVTQLEILPQIHALYCPLVYTDKAKNTLIRYKFQGENWMAHPLASLLHRYITIQGGYTSCNYITAVPISSKRFKERGYNQAELIAQQLSKYTGIPYVQFLRRVEDTSAAQTGKMNRLERLESKRFEPLDNVTIRPDSGVLLIDDILTTGSTLNECADILLNMGAGFIKAAVLASGRKDIGGLSA